MAGKKADATDEKDESKITDKGVDDDNQAETDEDQDEAEDEDNDAETADEDEDESDEDEEEESDDEDDKTPKFTKRLTQFKGETPEQYAKNLETAYLETSKEGIKLSRENKDLKAAVDRIEKAMKANPDLAKAISEEAKQPTDDQPTDPDLLWARSERDRVWAKEYQSFAEAHPEIETDPKLADDLDNALKVVREVVYKETGRLVGMGEGLKKAWKILEKDDQDEQVRMAARDTASKGKTATSKKSGEGDKPKFSEKQIQVTMDMMSVDRQAALKMMSKFNK